MDACNDAAPFPVRHNLAVATLLGGAVLWGLFWWPLKALAAGGVQGSFIQLVAYGLPALALAPLAWRSRAEWRKRLGLLAGIAVLGGWANASFVTALTYGSVVRVMLLFYLAPVWTILAARLFLGEPVTRLRLAALALAVCGLLATLGGAEMFAAPLSGMDLLALSSGFAFALNNVAIRAGNGLPDAIRSLAVFAGCALFAAAFMSWHNAAQPDLSGGQALALFALAMLWVLPGSLATFYGVARLEAGKAAILLLAELVVGVFSAMLIGNEMLSLKEAVGGALILAAAVIEARSEAPEQGIERD